MSSPLRRATAVAGLLLLAVGCGAPERPDVLLVTIDTLRADRLGCYGYERATTPTLDRLAKEGVRYDQCQTPIPITLPAHASLLTGLTPPEHGVRNNGIYRLPASVPTLTEELRAAGYRTGAFVAALPLAARGGLDRGFDRYDAELPEASASSFNFQERPATEVVAAAMDWVRGQSGEKPLFLWIHIFEPHAPYEPTAPYDELYADSPYDGEVAVADQAIGSLLSQLDASRSRERLTVITADHGEGLGEHGEPTHALFVYQSTLRVPLIFHAPSRWPQGVTVEGPVSLVDVAPTLLQALDIEPARLSPTGHALAVGEPAPQRPLYAESLYGMQAYGWSPLLVQREGDRKVIRSRISRAFDLSADPHERHDLYAHDEAPWADAELTALDERVVALAEKAPATEANREPSAEELDALAALGYVSGVSTEEADLAGVSLLAATRDRPDPTERLREFALMERAKDYLDLRRFDEAIADLAVVVEESPQNVRAFMLLGQAQAEAGRETEAIESYREAAKLRPDWAAAHADLGRLHARLDEPGEAVAEYRAAMALEPDDLGLRLETARYLQDSGELDQARWVLRNGMSDDLDEAATWRLDVALAQVLYQLRELQTGQDHLTRARQFEDNESLRLLQAYYLRQSGQWQALADQLAVDSALENSGEAQLLRGEALQRLARFEDAVIHYERAIDLADSLHLAHNNLAWALATNLDRAPEALAHAERALELAPDEAEYHDTYVEVLQRLGRDDDARAHLKTCLTRFPQHSGLAERGRILGLR